MWLDIKIREILFFQLIFKPNFKSISYLVCMFDVVGESLQGGISKFDQDNVFVMGIFCIWEA